MLGPDCRRRHALDGRALADRHGKLPFRLPKELRPLRADVLAGARTKPGDEQAGLRHGHEPGTADRHAAGRLCPGRIVVASVGQYQLRSHAGAARRPRLASRRRRRHQLRSAIVARHFQCPVHGIGRGRSRRPHAGRRCRRRRLPPGTGRHRGRIPAPLGVLLRTGTTLAKRRVLEAAPCRRLSESHSGARVPRQSVLVCGRLGYTMGSCVPEHEHFIPAAQRPGSSFQAIRLPLDSSHILISIGAPVVKPRAVSGRRKQWDSNIFKRIPAESRSLGNAPAPPSNTFQILRKPSRDSSRICGTGKVHNHH